MSLPQASNLPSKDRIDTHCKLGQLLTIELDNKLLVDIRVYVLTPRQSGNNNAEIFPISAKPRWTSASYRSLPRTLNMGILMARFLYGDDIRGIY